MKLSERIQSGIQHYYEKNPVPKAVSERIAEFLSSQSALSNPRIFIAEARTAYQALQIIFLCSLRKYWETDREHQILANQCFRYNYQGQWARVQEILETQDQSLEGIVNKIIETGSEDEFFGNILPDSLRYLEIFSNKVWKEPTRRPRRKVRKRGYDDKGTLRPLHDQHGIPGRFKPNAPERIDRRQFLSHPLLKKEDPGRGIVERVSFQKETNQNVSSDSYSEGSANTQRNTLNQGGEA